MKGFLLTYVSTVGLLYLRGASFTTWVAIPTAIVFTAVNAVFPGSTSYPFSYFLFYCLLMPLVHPVSWKTILWARRQTEEEGSCYYSRLLSLRKDIWSDILRYDMLRCSYFFLNFLTQSLIEKILSTYRSRLPERNALSAVCVCATVWLSCVFGSFLTGILYSATLCALFGFINLDTALVTVINAWTILSVGFFGIVFGAAYTEFKQRLTKTTYWNEQMDIFEKAVSYLLILNPVTAPLTLWNYVWKLWTPRQHSS